MRNLGLLLCLLLFAACAEEKTSEQHLVQARVHMDESRPDAAIVELKNALQKDAESAEARWLLGSLWLQRGEMAAAEKELRHAASLGWPADDTAPATARALLAQGKLVQVRELPVEGLSPGPQAELLALQALAELEQGETATARLLVTRAWKLAPDSEDVAMASASILAFAGEREAAVEALETLLAKAPGNPEAWSLLGDQHLAQGRVEEAVAAYDSSVAARPGDLETRTRRALANLQLENYDAAREDAALLLRRAPEYPAGHFIQGLIHFHDEAYQEAINSLDNALPAADQFPALLFYLANANFLQGNPEAAATYADRFLAQVPGSVAGRKLLAVIKLQQGRYAEVRAVIDPVLEQSPEDTQALNLKASALMLEGRKEEGIALLSRMVELEPDSARALVQLGAGMAAQGAYDQAHLYIQSAIELDPEYQQADVLLILYKLRLADFDGAIEAATDYARRNPTSTAARNLLGRAFLAAGRPEEAREAFSKSLRLDPGDPTAHQSLASLALARGDKAGAREQYLAWLEHQEGSLPALLGLARLEADAGNESAVTDYLQRAITANPDAVQPRLMLGRYYLARGKREQVAPLFSDLEPAQQQSPEVLRLLAANQLSSADALAAGQSLTQLLDTTPESADLYLMLGQASVGRGDIEGAIAQFERALELEEDHLQARIALAATLMRNDDAEGFDAQLRELLSRAPDDPRVLQLQIAAAGQKGDMATAARYSRRVFDQVPTSDNLAALVFYLEADGNLDEAQALMEDWLRSNPEDTRVMMAHAMVLGKQGEREASLSVYEKILSLQPGNYIALNNLAWEYRESAPDQALDYARRAVESAPGHPGMLDTLAMVQYERGEYKAAYRNIERALEIAPKPANFHYHAALIENALGEKERARQRLEPLLAENKDFPEYAEARALLDELGN